MPKDKYIYIYISRSANISGRKVVTFVKHLHDCPNCCKSACSCSVYIRFHFGYMFYQGFIHAWLCIWVLLMKIILFFFTFCTKTILISNLLIDNRFIIKIIGAYGWMQKKKKHYYICDKSKMQHKGKNFMEICIFYAHF